MNRVYKKKGGFFKSVHVHSYIHSYAHTHTHTRLHVDTQRHTLYHNTAHTHAYTTHTYTHTKHTDTKTYRYKNIHIQKYTYTKTCIHKNIRTQRHTCTKNNRNRRKIHFLQLFQVVNTKVADTQLLNKALFPRFWQCCPCLLSTFFPWDCGILHRVHCV